MDAQVRYDEKRIGWSVERFYALPKNNENELETMTSPKWMKIKAQEKQLFWNELCHN